MCRLLASVHCEGRQLRGPGSRWRTTGVVLVTIWRVMRRGFLAACRRGWAAGSADALGFSPWIRVRGSGRELPVHMLLPGAVRFLWVRVLAAWAAAIWVVVMSLWFWRQVILGTQSSTAWTLTIALLSYVVGGIGLAHVLMKPTRRPFSKDLTWS